MANTTRVGFRWARSATGSGSAQPSVEKVVASGYATKLKAGDPVKLAADNTIQRAAAGDTNIFGVIHGFKQVYDAVNGVLRVGASSIAASSTWPSEEKKNIAYVTPVTGQIFEVDADDGATATTEAAFRALVNENCDHVISDTDAALDISTHVTTTAQWRIKDLIIGAWNDYTVTRAKLLVECNESEEPTYATAVSA